jgi:hypothetical protein
MGVSAYGRDGVSRRSQWAYRRMGEIAYRDAANGRIGVWARSVSRRSQWAYRRMGAMAYRDATNERIGETASWTKRGTRDSR